MPAMAPVAELIKELALRSGGLKFKSLLGGPKVRPSQSSGGFLSLQTKGLRPPEHLAGQFHPDQKDSSELSQRRPRPPARSS